jgi:hypothetical protein
MVLLSFYLVISIYIVKEVFMLPLNNHFYFLRSPACFFLLAAITLICPIPSRKIKLSKQGLHVLLVTEEVVYDKSMRQAMVGSD